MKKLSEIKLKKPEFKKSEFKKPVFKKRESGGFKLDAKWYLCLLPAALTLLIYSIILAFKGIYPFGNTTIDYYDMAQQIAPFYYHVFDSLHGTKGFFYDWYSALGTNMAMSTSGCSNISPFNLFFLFIHRSSLLKSLSVFNGIKIMCMSLTMYFYLDKTHAKSPYFFRLVMSTGYAFCGFVLVLYITNQWVDIAVLFPILMYFYDRLIAEGKMVGYVITLAITIIASYYLGFMILIFLFLYTGLKLVTGYLFDGVPVEADSLSAETAPVIVASDSPSLVETEIGNKTGSDETDNFVIVEHEEKAAENPVDITAENTTLAEDAGAQSASISQEAREYFENTEVTVNTEVTASTEENNKKKFELKKPGFLKHKEDTAKPVKHRVRLSRSLPDLNLARLGLGTLISFALSAFILFPQLRQMLSSARFKNGSGEEATGIIGRYIAILKHVHGDYTTRWWTILGLSLATALILTGLIRFRKNHKMVFTSISMILLVVLELFFESINLIWHFGSYVQYPIRNGFIIYFVFAYLACYYAGELYVEGGPLSAPESDEKWDKYNEKWYFGFLFTLVGFLIFISFYKTHMGLPLRSVFHITSLIMAVALIFYIILFNAGTKDKPAPKPRKKKAAEGEEVQEVSVPKERRRFRPGYRWAACLLVLEILCYGFLLYGKPDFVTGYAEEPEQTGDFIYICEQLKDAFNFEPEYIARVKNPDESLNANYGFVLARPALSNWTHMIAPGEQDGAYDWGYSIEYTRLLDAGGTVFSDALLGVRNVISCVPMDECLYEQVDSAEVKVRPDSDEKRTYYLYKPVYTLPFGVKLNGIDEKYDEDSNIVKAHNSIYHSITGSDADIASWIVRDDNASAEDVSTDIKTANGSKRVDVNFHVGNETAVYLMGADMDTEFANSVITVKRGDEEYEVNVPTIGDMENHAYPAHFDNNAVYLGTYAGEDLIVSVVMDEEKGDYFDVDIIGIDLAAMDDLCAMYEEPLDEHIDIGKSAVTFTQAAGSDDEYMLLPMTYDKGWKVKNNGKRAGAKSYAGLFTVVPLKTGDNLVTMKFTPPGMRFGIFVSLLTLVICIIYLIAAKARKEEDTDKVRKAFKEASVKLNPVYTVAFLVVMFFMYALPIIVGICILIAG